MKNLNEENHYECNVSLTEIKEGEFNTIQINSDIPEINNFIDKKKKNSFKQEIKLRDNKNHGNINTENLDNGNQVKLFKSKIKFINNLQKNLQQMIRKIIF